MLAMIRHRGPEAAGLHSAGPAVLGHARLSIIDLAGGLQPIPNEDGSIWIIVNGEIFNYIELMAELKQRGHEFRTASDSETVLHLYEELGPRCLDHLIGQWALAIWDGRRGELLLARDRMGVRPLFYTVVDGMLLFASEIKALLAHPHVSHELDLLTLDQVFTYWAPLPGHTAFRDIRELPAGHYLKVTIGPSAGNNLQPVSYWQLEFPDEADERADARSVDDYAAELRELLVDATRLRLRADVPVGAYLSGGLDSSAITAIIRHYTQNELQTFSLAFRNQQFDESDFQKKMARAIGTQHHTIQIEDADIGRVFPDVIWHCETPLLRTGPAPMFLLSQLVRKHGFKVVLTGEGADEFLGGYSIFKEAKVRRWWASSPNSRLRPLLLRQLHGEVAGMDQGSQAFLQGFFANGLQETDDPFYSHLVRWRSTARQKRFFSSEVKAALATYDGSSALQALVAPNMGRWSALSKAQYTEAHTFMTQYLLASQGDRVAMAHAVEGRFPFLDHRVVEFAAKIPARLKLRGMNEKYVLKRAVADLLPAEITQRPKQPYRAPISTSFFGPKAPTWVGEILSETALRSAGIFDASAVSRLVKKCQSVGLTSEGDNMALVGVLSTQLLHQLFHADWGHNAQSRSDETEPVFIEPPEVLVTS